MNIQYVGKTLYCNSLETFPAVECKLCIEEVRWGHWISPADKKYCNRQDLLAYIQFMVWYWGSIRFNIPLHVPNYYAKHNETIKRCSIE